MKVASVFLKKYYGKVNARSLFVSENKLAVVCAGYVLFSLCASMKNKSL